MSAGGRIQREKLSIGEYGHIVLAIDTPTLRQLIEAVATIPGDRVERRERAHALGVAA